MRQPDSSISIPSAIKIANQGPDQPQAVESDLARVDAHVEIGREPVYGDAQDEILAGAADVLVEKRFGVEGGGAAAEWV